MTSQAEIEDLLAQAERGEDGLSWEGTFADYLRMVIASPSVSRLSHRLLYDAIAAKGVDQSATGEPLYGLFETEIFGLNGTLDKIVQYFASASRRLEVRKRILLLLGPPASGKSSIVTLIKKALEEYTRTDQGAVYGIKGCPMQEEPLHLIPHGLRPRMEEQYSVHIEGDLCPRCRYVLRTDYQGKVSAMPVTRVTFSEQEAVGIGYFIATNPNPADASLLVGSIDTANLEGDRLEVAGKAFRLDGEFNVGNRGMVEFVEIFKADSHLLTTLLGLAQEQLIKMERFGSVYADEVIVAHSNEGDFEDFKSDESSEALKDRIIAIGIPYSLTVQDEIEIYKKMLATSSIEHVHVAPLALSVASSFAVLSRLEPPDRQGMTLLDKLRLYNGEQVPQFSRENVVEMRRHYPNEGMVGISPRYVMNRLSAAASAPGVTCLSPLRALDSLWQGLRENISLDEEDTERHSRDLGFIAAHIGFVKDAVDEYSNRAIQEVQRAFKEGFEQSGTDLLALYLDQLRADGGGNEREMRDMEKPIGIVDRGRAGFREEISLFFANLERRGVNYDYASEPRLKAAIETRLCPSRREVERTLTRPRSAKQQVEWRRERSAVYKRLISAYGYCPQCADDLLNYVVHVLKRRDVLKTPKNEGIEWQWPLDPTPPAPAEESD